MKIKHTRLANLRDTEKIADMAIALGMTTAYKEMPVDKKKMIRVVEKVIIGTPNECAVVVSVDDNDSPVGFIAGMPFEVLFSDESLAIEIGWWVIPGTTDEKKRYLELRAAFEEWARRKGYRYAQYATLNPTEKDIRDLNKNSKSTLLELVYHRKIEEQ